MKVVGVSPVNLNGALGIHEGLYSIRACTITRRFILLYIRRGLIRPSFTFTVKEAESAGHSEITD